MQKIYIYFDESRHIMSDPHKYMVLGALWFNDIDKEKIKTNIVSVLEKYKYTSEIKWSTLSTRRLAVYKALADTIKDSPINFRAIIVDKSKIDLDKYHNNNVELSHTKFIYLLIKELLNEENTEYVILLDYKDRDIRTRLSQLRKFLALNCLPSSKIVQLQEIISRENKFVQFVDLLIGAIGYDKNKINSSPAKTEFCSYLKEIFGISTFRTTARKEKKFNVFNIILT